jgi:hypothetical protein
MSSCVCRQVRGRESDVPFMDGEASMWLWMDGFV